MKMDGRTLRFEVWQLRHDWVVRFLRRFLWSTSPPRVNSKSMISPLSCMGWSSSKVAVASMVRYVRVRVSARAVRRGAGTDAVDEGAI